MNNKLSKAKQLALELSKKLPVEYDEFVSYSSGEFISETKIKSKAKTIYKLLVEAENEIIG